MRTLSHECSGRTHPISSIGSTHAVTPREFVDDLKVLELGGVGSKALPNGVGEGHGQRPLQDFYDELYFTKDAPRPQPQAPPSSTRQTPGRQTRPSPIPSYASGTSVATNSSGHVEKEKEKKKKRGLFHF